MCSAFLALVGGCAAPVDDALPPTDDALELRSASSALCSRKAHVLVRSDAGCPNVGLFWSGASVFDVGTPWLETEDTDPLPEELEHYCRYTWSGPGVPSAATIGNLYNLPNVEAASPSCQVVDAATSDVLATELGEDLREIFRTNTGRPTPSDLGLPAAGGPSEPMVTVMVVDTVPDDPTVVPTSRHGLHMGNIIEDLACPDDAAGCRVEVGYTVGLPRRNGGVRDYEHGGMVAKLEEVAAGIYAATRRWEIDNDSRPFPSRLVINLSLGWEEEHDVFGANPPDLEAAESFVRTAMEYASCRGALIVAAAGNMSAACGATGPVYPAGWETLQAPNANRCSDFGITASPGTGPGYRPLVHAVGGLDIDLQPMPGSRPAATPRLLASATHIAAGDPLRTGISGTSAAAAVASGAAALVWANRPGLDAAEVMDWVHGSGGMVSGFTPDFGIVNALPTAARRVDACMALDAACAAPGAMCPTLPLTECMSKTAPASLVGLQSTFDLLEPDHSTTVQLPLDTSCVDACGDTIDIYAVDGATVACEALVPLPTDSLANPTPNPIGCSTCGIEPALATVHLSLHPDFDGVLIEDVIVTVTTNGDVKVPISLGPLVLSSLEHDAIVIDDPAYPTDPIVAAEITMAFDGRRPTTDPMWIR
ncbi:MAG: S8 family serine peptidase [Nannocystaceae bacterium]